MVRNIHLRLIRFDNVVPYSYKKYNGLLKMMFLHLPWTMMAMSGSDYTARRTEDIGQLGLGLRSCR